jgi:hypothetical protein
MADPITLHDLFLWAVNDIVWWKGALVLGFLWWVIT